MQSNHKIVLFEGELKAGKGHHYNHLVENSFFYKNKGKILWFVNKKFEKKNLFVPKFVKVLNKIDTGNRKIALSNLISKVHNGWRTTSLAVPCDFGVDSFDATEVRCCSRGRARPK